jgi:hypothetical protein
VIGIKKDYGIWSDLRARRYGFDKQAMAIRYHSKRTLMNKISAVTGSDNQKEG